MAKFDDYYAVIDMKERKEAIVIDPITHSINSYYAQGGFKVAEHTFTYIDDHGRYSEATVDNMGVKFIKKVVNK